MHGDRFRERRASIGRAGDHVPDLGAAVDGFDPAEPDRPCVCGQARQDVGREGHRLAGCLGRELVDRHLAPGDGGSEVGPPSEERAGRSSVRGRRSARPRRRPRGPGRRPQWPGFRGRPGYLRDAGRSGGSTSTGRPLGPRGRRGRAPSGGAWVGVEAARRRPSTPCAKPPASIRATARTRDLVMFDSCANAVASLEGAVLTQ